mmetsp:Transcript_13245/g.24821  ORF Transcript_13245/g.24821 Transcript_13245/m.24821 type:complete len:1121 (+) Transcript_13245:1588-4950(+)
MDTLANFFAVEDDDTGVVVDLKPANCASSLPMPTDPRPKSNFVGLLNQGATCYLNSLIQTCYMTPELRNAVFDLPLCVDSPLTPSDFLPEGQKRTMVLALQELFAKLFLSDERALSTRALTDSFNWSGADVVVQQDVQELNRVLFNVIEESLASTQHSELISKLYKGMFSYQTICMNCAYMSEREEAFCDINVQVKGFKSLVDGLRHLTGYEDLTGDNQYFCEVCQAKVDAKRGMQLKQLPPILTIALQRFEFDWAREERKKINNKYTYPLELDMFEFVPGSSKYELFAVIIHGGSAFGGHYHAFIRDVMGTGTWEIDPDKEETPTPSVTAAAVEEEAQKDESVDFEGDFKIAGKKKRKRLRKAQEGQPQKKPAIEKEKESELFPEECKNSALHTQWFDFNDGTVRPISSGRLAKVFGGSGETAYILVYRNVELNTDLSVPQPPKYWQDFLANQNAQLVQERLIHEDMKQRIEVTLQPADMFALHEGFLKYNLDSETKGETLNFRLDDKVSQLREAVTSKFGEAQAYEVNKTQTPYLAVERNLDSLDNEATLRDAGVSHKSTWLIVLNENAALDAGLCWVGQGCDPIELQVSVMDEVTQITVIKAWPLVKLQEIIAERTGIDPANQKIQTNIGGVIQDLKASDQDKSFADLKIIHKAKLTISFKDTLPALSDSAVIVESQKHNEDDVSILIYDELDPEKVVKHYVSLNWRLKQMLNEIKQLFHIESKNPIRLRKLIDNSLFTQEQLNLKLDRLGFEEGGLRLQMEHGDLPRQGEIVVRVGLDPCGEDTDVFTNPRSTVREFKEATGKALELEISDFKFCKTDWLRDPAFILKNDNETLMKAMVKSGDFILVVPNTTVLAAEQVKIQLWKSETGLPDSSVFLQEVTVSHETTVNELKQILLTIPELNAPAPEYLRLRERTKFGFPGRILKEAGKSLRKINITVAANIVAQILTSPEQLSNNSLSLFVCERLSRDRDFGSFKEILLDVGASPNIDQLYDAVLRGLELDWPIADVTLAKYVPHEFIWDVMKDSRKPGERGSLLQRKVGKGTEVAGIFNLRKAPINLKEGDLIAIRLNSISEGDDFQSEKDLLAREIWLKGQEENKKRPKRPKAVEKGVKIQLG